MNGTDETAVQRPTVTRSCRVDNCSCQDSRIVSHRRAAFFAAVARTNGETADRNIAPEVDWRLPAEATDANRRLTVLQGSRQGRC